MKDVRKERRKEVERQGQEGSGRRWESVKCESLGEEGGGVMERGWH